MADKKNKTTDDGAQGFSPWEVKTLIGTGVFVSVVLSLLPSEKTGLSLVDHIKDAISKGMLKAEAFFHTSRNAENAEVVLAQVESGKLDQKGLDALNRLIEAGKKVKIGGEKGTVSYVAKKEEPKTSIAHAEKSEVTQELAESTKHSEHKR